MVKPLKGKTWFAIRAPKYLGDKAVGETLADDPKLITGRVVESTLFDLTGDPSKYYVKLFFKITGMEGNAAVTVFHGHDCTRDFIARVVQLFTSRIDTNNVVALKDGKLRVKTLAVSNKPLRSAVASDLRKEISRLIVERVSALSVEEFVKEFIAGNLQRDIRAKVSKIYPLRAFEIRKSEVL